MAKKPTKPAAYGARKSSGGFGRKLVLSSAFAAVAAGGGAYYYNYQTETNVDFTVEKIEHIYDVSCHTRQTVMRAEFTTPATANAAEKTEVKDVTENEKAQACTRTPILTVIHTDAGDFYNNPSLLHAKSQANADSLTTRFAIGKKYTAEIYGANIKIPATGLQWHKNMLSAKAKYEFAPQIEITPLPQTYQPFGGDSWSNDPLGGRYNYNGGSGYNNGTLPPF